MKKLIIGSALLISLFGVGLGVKSLADTQPIQPSGVSTQVVADTQPIQPSIAKA